jgi:hypothetical protein
MVAVLAHWEWRDMVPLTEAPLWNLPLRDFGITDWRMVPVSGIRNSERKVPLREFSNYEKAFEGDDLQRVFIEPRSHEVPETVWLHDFEHPEDCIYIFGSAHYNPAVMHKRPGDVVVSIKTLQDKGVMWPHQAAMIVLYDRCNRGNRIS